MIGHRLLEFNPIPTHRGLTVDAAEVDIAINEAREAEFFVNNEVGFMVPVQDVDASMRYNEVMELAQRWEMA